MPDFFGADLSGTQFERSDLSGARFRAVTLAGTWGIIERLWALSGHTEPVEEPGWPQSRSYPVRECLLCILNEEWKHRLYAERDLDALESS